MRRAARPGRPSHCRMRSGRLALTPRSFRQHFLQRVESLRPELLGASRRVSPWKLAVRDLRTALPLSLAEERDFDRRPILPVNTPGAMRRGATHLEIDSAEPARAGARVGEGLEQIRDRHRERAALRGLVAAVTPLSDLAETSDALVADGNRLRPPVRDVELVVHVLRDLAVR